MIYGDCMNAGVIFRLSLFFCILSFSMLNAETRGLKQNVFVAEDVQFGKQYALLIGINTYKQWIPLTNPVNDVKQIKSILNEKYYIDEFFELYDNEATKENILGQFQKIMTIIQPHDSLFVFYAGHGHLDDLTGTGFWIPVDGGLNPLVQENWLPNSSIKGIMKNMKSRHILVVSDSCFSGELLTAHRGYEKKIDNDYFRNAYNKISRQIITSGASETVPDKSEFAMQFKRFLEGTSKPFIDPLMMFSEIRSGMTKTTPLFGNIEGTGYQEGSSFLFFSKKGNEELFTKRSTNIPEEPVRDDKLIALQNQLAQAETTWKRKEKYYTPMVASGSFLLTTGLISCGVSGSFWVVQNYYRDLYQTQYDGLMNGDKTIQGESVIANAELTNVFFMSALIMIPVSAVFTTTGVILLAASPNKRFHLRKIDTIKDSLKKYTVFLSPPEIVTGRDRFQIAMTLHF